MVGAQPTSLDLTAQVHTATHMHACVHTDMEYMVHAHQTDYAPRQGPKQTKS